ncbi:MAG: hypothetical protein ACFFDT_30230, partial [Candidatus Hodarchaeota archaeon]
AYVLTECQIIRTNYWISVDRSYYSYVTKLFNYMEFNPPSAYLTGNFCDRGVDTDSNGKYDEIIIDVEVNITQRGEYEIELNIRPYIPIWDTNFWGYSPNQRYNRGIHNITVQLYVTLPYSLRLDTAYIIEFVTVRETEYWEVVDELSRPYITLQYKASEFEIQDVILTGSTWENVIDSDSDGKYNFIEIVLELNVTQSGVFYIEYNIRSFFSGYSDWKYIEVEYQKGIHNFSISTGGAPLYALTYGSSIILEIPHFEIFDSNLHLLDKLPTNYFTKTYSSKFFNIPTAYFTGSLHDYPVNTDDDGYMEEIQIYVQVNITKAGWFTSNLLIVIIKWSDYGDIYDSLEVNKSITQYFERGIQFVVIHLDRELLYSMDHDITWFEIYSMRIFDSNFNLCDYRYPYYSSTEYYTHIFSPGGSQSSTSYGTSVSLSDDEPWAPPLNLVFGSVGLSIFLSILYLLQRTKRQ